MATNIPPHTPLQQQIDEFVAEGASWLPTDLLRALLHPIGQLMASSAAGNALKEGEQAPDFTRRLDPSVIVGRLNELKG